MTKLLNKKGFTLIELMVVIVIVGILAAVAIPKFTMASHKAKMSEFPTVLMGIFTAEGTYMNESGSYTSAAANNNAQWTVIGLDNPNIASNNFSYVTTAGGTGTDFTATATIIITSIGTATSGETATIDNTQLKSTGGDIGNYATNW